VPQASSPTRIRRRADSSVAKPSLGTNSLGRLRTERADARTRTGDPFITSVDQMPPQVAPGHAKSHRSKESARPRWPPQTANGKDVDPA
jgi:hypothetical protein